MQCLLPFTTIETTLSVTISISLQKNMTVRLDNFPGKPFCLQPTGDIDHPTGTHFVLLTIMDTNNAPTFTPSEYAVREQGKPPGNYPNFTPSSQFCNEGPIHRRSTRTKPNHYGLFETSSSNFRMKTNSNQAQVERDYAVRLIWLIYRNSISLKMVLNDLVWSF